MTAAIRKVLAENPGEFDPRKYIGAAREALVEMVKYKNEKRSPSKVKNKD